MEVKRVGRRLAVIGVALALTLGMTWPLPRCLGSCLGASEDPLVSVYFLRWVSHALTTPGVPLLDASIFAPYPRTLAVGEYLPTWALLTGPVILLTGNPVTGHNVAVLLSYALAMLGAAALTAHLARGGPTPEAALLAGLVFACSPRMLHQAHNLQTLSASWLPWIFLALERFLDRPTWARAAVVGGLALALAGSSMNVWTYAVVAGLLLLGTAVLVGDRRPGRVHGRRGLAVGLGVAGLVAAYVAPYRALAREWGLSRTPAEVERYSLAWRDFLGVPPEHLFHRLTGIGLVVDLDHEALFPGLTVLLLAAAGLASALGDRHRRPRLLPYVALGGAAAVLALGPTLETPWGPLWLPYRALYDLVPGFAAIRTPRRFAVFVALALALLAALGAARLTAGLGPAARRAALAGVAGLILLESMAAPFPGTVRRLDAGALPPVYRWLESQPPATTALELPMHEDWEKVAAAAFHLRRTVNGWASFFPPHYFALAEAMAAFPDPRTLALVAGLRPDVVLVDPRRLDPARAAVLAGPVPGLRLLQTVGEHRVYRVEAPTPPGPEALEATAVVTANGEGCLTLRNPSGRFVPLYPLHRLRITVERAGEAVATGLFWLPLDLAPGAARTECLRLGGPGGPIRIRGEVEDIRGVYRFSTTSDGRPGSLSRRPAS
jgi:hypothetical protein